MSAARGALRPGCSAAFSLDDGGSAIALVAEARSPCLRCGDQTTTSPL